MSLAPSLLPQRRMISGDSPRHSFLSLGFQVDTCCLSEPHQLIFKCFFLPPPCSLSDECQTFPLCLSCTVLLNFYHLRRCLWEAGRDEKCPMNPLSGCIVSCRGLLPSFPLLLVGCWRHEPSSGV